MKSPPPLRDPSAKPSNQTILSPTFFSPPRVSHGRIVGPLYDMKAVVTWGRVRREVAHDRGNFPVNTNITKYTSSVLLILQIHVISIKPKCTLEKMGRHKRYLQLINRGRETAQQPWITNQFPISTESNTTQNLHIFCRYSKRLKCIKYWRENIHRWMHANTKDIQHKSIVDVSFD